MQPRIVDISHYNVIAPDGFRLAADAGIWAIIHKCTQGNTYVDKEYAKRRQAAKDAGLLWGAYHFATGDDVEEQVNHFVQSSGVEDDPNILLALDYEANPGSTMEPEDMVAFLKLAETMVHAKLALYSGNLLKETLSNLTLSDQQYVCSHRLWLAHYNLHAVLPEGFHNYWIWQYTGDGIGPEPHRVPGISIPGNPGIDLNVYNGTLEQLQKEWTPSGNNTSMPKLVTHHPEEQLDPYHAFKDWFDSIIHGKDKA